MNGLTITIRRPGDDPDLEIGDPRVVRATLAALREVVYGPSPQLTHSRKIVRRRIPDTVLTPVWRGTWRPGISYGANGLVNHKNGLWVSQRITTAEPGAGDSGWQLAVKGPR